MTRIRLYNFILNLSVLSIETNPFAATNQILQFYRSTLLAS